MANKNSSLPRRIYTASRSALAYVNFEGKFFGCDIESTKINVEGEVVCERVPGGGRPRIFVKQAKGSRNVKETWSMVEIHGTTATKKVSEVSENSEKLESKVV